MAVDLEPGTLVYTLLLFAGVVLAVTVVNVVFIDASIGGAVVRGIAIGLGAAVMNWYIY
ncbi:hypothetical protein [Halorussus amylolyticus]|uniref:hypothetical protein n=1 Tax=Halorussus amylolyticus TaxID=1126242 RepID=UPI00138ED8AF|nr:hypothetical protein [Halorussus amylolyticus]